MREKKKLEVVIETGRRLTGDVEEIETYFLLIDEDPDLKDELEAEIEKFALFIDDTETLNYLNGENDANNAFLSIHPGAGGTESQDWAEMLLRMYLRFAERNKYLSEIVDILAGEKTQKFLAEQLVQALVQCSSSGKDYPLPGPYPSHHASDSGGNCIVQGQSDGATLLPPRHEGDYLRFGKDSAEAIDLHNVGSAQGKLTEIADIDL